MVRFAGPRARPASVFAVGRRERASSTPLDDLARPQQHRDAVSLGRADHVGADVHPVAQVDVRCPGGPNITPRARGAAAVGVRTRVLARAQVRLDLGDAAPRPRPPSCSRSGRPGRPSRRANATSS